MQHRDIGVFKLMQDADVKATRVGLLSVFLACGQLGALSKGECFHGYVIQTGFQEDISVLTAVLDMYAKCGNLTTARMVFHGAGGKDVVCWSAMIASYGYHGLGKEAVSTLNQMMDAGVMPNDATFTSILSACSHSGLFEEGRLKEAQEFMEQMPMAPNSSLLGSLLGACRVHGDLELGEKIADRILDSDPRCSGYYVILSNMYASRSRWNHIEKLRKRMSGRQVCKEQGISFIEFHHQIHKFGVGDRSHPQSEEIYSYLDKLLTRMKQLGYIPQLEFSLHDVEDENKELALSYHSERLAIAFGLINTIPGTPIRVMKNLRVCGDCHNAIKLITLIVKREIILRDTNRFHHFDKGVCSCGDHW
ncbi:hypothetical protein HPP92_024219 [Vanilla planifolia]|uniref:DYW domain-containing protein n=1 Tax=Vanilla planifolia TaxID=51239 RepID=A0A835UEH2_VANPL|nr:hypothetical protein HPP92_024219 [Vanilla planifolia]